MKQLLNIHCEDAVVTLADSIVYSQCPDWCDAVRRPLSLSLMRSRQFFSYDKREKLPVLVWLCGGGFTTVDTNVWAPELAFFAKRGYAVASVEYSVSARTRFPQQLVQIKQAIRYLRAHAEEWGLDPSRFAVMGESAGGYFSALAALTGNDDQYSEGEYLEQSDSVKAAVCWYPVTRPARMQFDPDVVTTPQDFPLFPDLLPLIGRHAAPFLLLHGNADTQVPHNQSEQLYEALVAENVPAELCILDGADHADAHFVQPQIKERVLAFLNQHIGLPTSQRQTMGGIV